MQDHAACQRFEEDGTRLIRILNARRHSRLSINKKNDGTTSFSIINVQHKITTAAWLTRRVAHGWEPIQVPFAINKRPTFATLARWTSDGVALAVDGCKIEPDGVCQHGAPSWLLAEALI